MDTNEVVEYLLQRAVWTASRSSGPGGQRRDKVETRAELTLNRESLEGLDEPLASRLAHGLGLDRRPLRMTSQEERSLARNHSTAAERFALLVAEILAPPAPPRRPTRPSRSRREARLADKSRRATVKQLRQSPGGD